MIMLGASRTGVNGVHHDYTDLLDPEGLSDEAPRKRPLPKRRVQRRSCGATRGEAAARDVGPRCDPRDVPASDDPRPPTLSRKDQARQLRRAAYLKAKAQRANDPRLIAIKEAMKKRRREAYQAAKERRKAAVAGQKEKQRAARDAEMQGMLRKPE